MVTESSDSQGAGDPQAGVLTSQGREERTSKAWDRIFNSQRSFSAWETKYKIIFLSSTIESKAFHQGVESHAEFRMRDLGVVRLGPVTRVLDLSWAVAAC